MSDIADLIDELNEHGFEDTVTERKVAVLYDTIADICAREPWPFLEKNITLTFNGTNPYASNWPADFSKGLAITRAADGRTIQWERRETIKKRYANTLTQVGIPEWYYFLGGRAQFLPIPSAGETLDMDYIATHPTITVDTEEAEILIPARHHRVIAVGALYKLYMLEDDPELAQVFRAEYEARLQTMREDLSRLQYDRPDRILVLDWDENDLWPSDFF
jgi:hypothetical protein